MQHSNHARRGWTVVETLIAVLILGFIIVGIFTVFSRVARHTDTGAWKLGQQQKMRASIKHLFQELSQATYPSTVYPDKTVVEKSGYQLQFREGEINPWETEGEILKFWVCTPGKANFPDSYSQHVVECSLTIQKHDDSRPQLMFSRKVIKQSPKKKDYLDGAYDKEMFEDIDFIQFTPEVFTDEASMDPNNKNKIRFAVEVRAAHPKFPDTKVTLREQVVLQVDIKGAAPTDLEEDPK